MVNTLIVDSNLKLSAKCLDNKRLNKQKVEALSILRGIKYLQILGKYYNIDIPTNDNDVYSWIRKVLAIYKKENFTLLFKNFGLFDDIINLDITSGIKVIKPKKVIRQSYNHIINTINNNIIIIIDGNKKISCNFEDFVSLNDIWITIGYLYHPAVLMWFNYFDALLIYTQIHIDECISRGFNNTIKLKIINNNPKLPYFISDAHFLLSHRSNLVRKEPLWYKPIFPQSNDTLEYIWPFSPKK